MSQETTLAPGSVIDARYKLVAPLGEGTFADVWRAQDLRLSGRAVAVKFLKPEFLEHGEVVGRFEAEADALAQVQHPHVVAVHDRGAWEGQRFLVTELVEGQALDFWLDEYRTASALPPLQDVRRIFDQVCAGIGAAHAVRAPGPIVHRDIKPENVLVRRMPDGEPFAKVVDFGIAQLGQRVGTRTGARMGTFLYMAPEQALGNTAALGPWTDVFALGVLLVEMLTLRAQPSEAEPWWGAALRRNGDPVASLAVVRDDVPRAVWDAVAQALDSETARRPPDANALRTILDACWSGAPRPPPPRPAPPPVAASPTRRRSWAPLIAGVVAASLAVSLGIVAAIVRSERPRPATTRHVGTLRAPTTATVAETTRAPTTPFAPTVSGASPVAADGALSEFLGRWSRAVSEGVGVDALDDYYVAAVQFRRSGALANADSVRRYYTTHVRDAGTFQVDWARSEWLHEDPSSPDVSRACRLPDAEGDVIKVRAWAVETAVDRDGNTRGEVPCDRLEGRYLLRLRRVAGALRICHETWSLREGVCASCPAARACQPNVTAQVQ